MKKNLLLIFLVFSFGFFANAQPSPQGEPSNLSNWRVKQFNPVPDTLILDSLTVIPETVKLKDLQNAEILPSSLYFVIENKLVWVTKTNLPKGVEASFRVFPFDLSANHSKKDTAWIGAEDFSDYIPYQYNPYKTGPEILEADGLTYSGSFARGISFGNNQDLVLNSSFNLQMAGNIGDEIEILAAISDNNIPLQPEGNTQQLQEFDQVFIQLKRRKSTLIAGDYQLEKPTGYFMNYFQRLQGATFFTETGLGDLGTLDLRVNGAVARGQFARNRFIGQEGNQGPYKLSGNSGERFIIILAGTERVFIDGELLVRGSENDYVIDYNVGEITFTTNRLITKDKRIVVEFSYSVNNYPRTLYGTNLAFRSPDEKLQVYFNMLSQQDGKNQSANQEITPFQRQQFMDLGDAAATSLFSGVDTLEEFDIDRPMYKMVDTLVNNILYDSVYVQTFNPDSARYIIQFSNVGQGNGNYRRINATTNFRVYAWIAPDINGTPQGDFEPVVQLVPPEKRQLYTLGATYKISKNGQLMSEIALSNADINTFSDLDASDNVGLAARTGYNHKFFFSNEEENKSKALSLEASFDYEFVHANFREIEPYRPVEFTRDWNTDNSIQTNEHIGRGGLNLVKPGFGNLRYEFSAFLRDSVYTGLRHFAQAGFSRKGFNLKASASLTDVEGLSENSLFFRPKLDLSKTFKQEKGWTIGFYGEREKNERRSVQSDTLLNASFFYDLLKVYAKSPQTKKLSFSTFYSRRFDYFPETENFSKTTVADEVNLEGTWRANPGSILSWNLTYRDLKIDNESLTTERPLQTYLGRLEYLLNVKKGFIRANTVYELGAGQEKKIEFTYLEVNPGEGVYTWIDRNEDGIKQLDEFELSVFQDEADHIRVSTFSDEFVRSNNVQFSQSLSLNPVRIWRKEKGIKLFISRFSTQSSLRIARKTVEDVNVQAWNPFQLSIPDSSLLSVSSNIRNTLFFNRINPKYGFEIGMLDNQNRIILTTGYEDRQRSEQFLKTRWNISKKVGTSIRVSTGFRENDSEFFDNKDYKIKFYTVSPQVTLLLSKNFRTILKYEFLDNKNQQGDMETAVSHDFSAELTYNKISKTEIRANLSFVDVTYTGDNGTPVEFAILQGLRNGSNYLWNLTVERRIAKNVLMNISYEGRKTGESRVIHVGRASVRATF